MPSRVWAPVSLGCLLIAVGCDMSMPRWESLDLLYLELMASVGEARASSVDRCRAIPVGQMGCGGPGFYVVYSLDDGDPDRLERIARRYTEIQARNPGISECPGVDPPTIILEGGRCVAGVP